MFLAILLAVFAAVPVQDTTLAGQYYQGDGTGVNWYLTLQTDHHYSFTWRGCLGEYGKSAGRWSFRDHQLTLRSATSAGMADKLPLTYRIVRWGERTYLVPADDVVAFCNYINQGVEPRDDEHGLVFLKDGDWNRRTLGLPDLPELNDFLLAQPIRARIVSSDGARGTVDAGRRAGLRIGMILTAQDASVLQARVVRLGDESATVESLYGDKLLVHTHVSTLLYDPNLQP
jgi:hypothetical protein